MIEVLLEARIVLVSLLSGDTLPDREDQSIFSLQNYSAESLQKIVMTEHERTMGRWESYLGQRDCGEGHNPFGSRADAELWLQKHAPAKYFD